MKKKDRERLRLRCIFRVSIAFRARIIDAAPASNARAYPRCICRYACACRRIHLQTRPPTHGICARHLRAFCMHTRALAYERTHARTHVYIRARLRGRVEILRPSVKPPRARENYCTTRDLSLIINTPTRRAVEFFSSTQARVRARTASTSDDAKFR